MRSARALERVTAGSHAEYVESVDQTWFVEPYGMDRTVFTYTTMVAGHETLVWRRIKLFSNGAPAPDVATMAFQARSGDAELDAVRIVARENEVQYVVFFDTPIRGDAGSGSRAWSIEYVWPGLWDPFRADGEDSVEARLTTSGGAVGATGVPTGHRQPSRPLPQKGSRCRERGVTRDRAGSQTLVWEIPEAQSGQPYTGYFRSRAGE